MKIISWDVGIKNLAYCIMEDCDEKICKIYDWNIINLIENNYKCLGCLENKNCDRPVTHTLCILNKTHNLCKLHKVRYNDIITNELNKIKNSETSTCECVIKTTGLKCNKKSYYKYNNLNYCNQHINYNKKKIINSKPEKIVQNANKVPIGILKQNLINKLDKIPHLLDVKKVLIENQPSLRNPKMKAIADTLYCWFLIRGLIDKKNNSLINEIKYISPSNKLKINNDNTIQLLSTTKNDTEKYKLTKQLSIIYTKQLLNNNDNTYLEFFNKQKKKDDLADALLQGIYYIKILSKIN